MQKRSKAIVLFSLVSVGVFAGLVYINSNGLSRATVGEPTPTPEQPRADAPDSQGSADSAPPAVTAEGVGRDLSESEAMPAPPYRLPDGTEILFEGEGFVLKRTPDGELVRENAWQHLSIPELESLSASEFGANAELFHRYLQSDEPDDWERARTYGLRTIVMAPEQWRGTSAAQFIDAMDYHYSSNTTKAQLVEVHRYAQLAELLGAEYTYRYDAERELLALGEPLPAIDDLITEINELSLQLTGGVLLEQEQE